MSLIVEGNQVAILENTEGTDVVYPAYKEKLLLVHKPVPGSSLVRNLTVCRLTTLSLFLECVLSNYTLIK